MADVVDLGSHYQPSDRPREARLANLADLQHGPVAHRQLIELGFGPGAIKYRVKIGRFRPLYLGVYAIGHTALTPLGRMMAAVLACGPRALLSHRSAAGLWGIWNGSRSVIDVTVPGRSRAGQRGIDLHLVRSLHPCDVAVKDRIPVTSVARTLLDLAEVVSPQLLERALEAAERRRLLDLAAIDDLLARSPGRHGRRSLVDVLGGYRGDPHTKSELERRFLDFCRRHGVPAPAVNAVVEGYEVDMHWPGQRLVVELDSREFHATSRAFEEDRARDVVLQMAGQRVVRVTGRRLRREQRRLASELLSLLALG